MSRMKVALTPQQLRLRENQIFLALAIVVGVLAGLSAVLFSLAISGTTRAFFGLQPSWMRLLLIPPAVSLITGVLLYKFFPGVRGSGVPQTKAAFHLNGGVIPPRVPLGKFLTGVLCIGSGTRWDAKGPSVQIGAGIASASASGCGCRPRASRSWCRWAPPARWRPRSTRRWPQCSSRSRRSSAT
jgi:H+/Cl- antiporter ClcA